MEGGGGGSLSPRLPTSVVRGASSNIKPTNYSKQMLLLLSIYFVYSTHRAETPFLWDPLCHPLSFLLEHPLEFGSLERLLHLVVILYHIFLRFGDVLYLQVAM